MAYFNLDYKPVPADTLRHELNERYKGSRRFELHAPDAPGTLLVWACSEEEAREHLTNALFDFIFRPLRVGASRENPKCIYCGSKTQSKGRNSSGKRAWQCMNAECKRAFVLDRSFRGGINHPSQSKKPDFAKLIRSGVPVRDAADQLGIHPHTAVHWGMQIAAADPKAFEALNCPCGKPLRHRGSCLYRMKRGGLRVARPDRAKAGAA